MSKADPIYKVRSPPNIFGLFRYADGRDRILLGFGSVLAVLHGASLPILGLVFGHMTNAMIPEHNAVNMTQHESHIEGNMSFWEQEQTQMFYSNLADNLPQFSLYYTFIGIVVIATSFAQSYCWDLTCERQIYKIRRYYFHQVMRQDISWFDTQGNENLSTKLFDDLERVRDGMGSKMSLVIQHFSGFISGLIVGLCVNLKLTLFIIAISPILVGCAALVAKVASSSASRELLKYAEAGKVADEAISNIRTVQAFGGEQAEIKRYTDGLYKGWREALSAYYRIAFAYVGYYLLLYSSYGGTLWFGALQIYKGESTPGAVFTVLLSTMGGALQLGGALPFINAVNAAIGSAASIFKIIDRTPTIDAYREDGITLASVTGHISFKNVMFYYPLRPGIPVLQDLTLVIKPGQTVAVVGSSGAGKSTLVSLLLRFYDPDKGKVILDGVNLKDLNLRWLRSQIGLVSQEPVLFTGSIRQNIKYGRDDVTDEQITWAAKTANAHDFIKELPAMYETPVGDRGTQLSGGQKQRIAIARALVRDPQILLLDEATSALDTQSEDEVQQALERAMQGRTTIIIAHRLSTIKAAQVIYVLKEGRVEEMGDHDELMVEKGLYYNLVVAQKSFHSSKDNDGDVRNDVRNIEPEEEKDKNQKSRINRPLKVRDEPSLNVPLSRVMSANLPEYPWLIASFIGFICNGCVIPLFAFLFGQVFSTLQLEGEDLYSTASFWALMFVCLGVAAGTAQFTMLVTTVNAAERLIFRLRQWAFTNILRQDIGWFDLDQNVAGKLTTKLAKDAPLIKQVAGIRTGQILSAFTTLILAISLALIQGWQLALLLVAAGPFVAAASFQEMRLLRRSLKRDSDLMVQAGRVAAEAIVNVKTVQALGREATFLNMYLAFLNEPFREAKTQAARHAVVFALTQSVTSLLYAAAFRFGAYLLEIDAMTPSQIYKTFFIIAFSSASIGQIAVYTQDLARAKLSTGLVFQLIDGKTEIDAFDSAGIKAVVIGLISFRNIHFRYPARPEVEILKGANLEIEPGSTVAIVGASGGGKSTFVSLIQRFYDPLAGSVCVDGIDIKELNLAHLRRNIGLVTQEPILFACTIAQNISYGEKNVNMDAVIEVAKIANIHNFIISLPQGYNTLLGGREAQLSGGQKQRLAIARALLRNPKILILDEATSALDTESEQIVQAALEKARNGRTCIVIAHRLSTVESADKIAVLSNGVIEEEGTHQELLSKGQLYYNLVKKQRH